MFTRLMMDVSNGTFLREFVQGMTTSFVSVQRADDNRGQDAAEGPREREDRRGEGSDGYGKETELGI